MFSKGFLKIAVVAATLTPEEYYSLLGEKDPYVGAVAGALSGAVAGALKGKKGSKAKSALIGAGLGGGAGASAGHVGGKALRHFQSRRIRRLAGELKLKSSPGRQAYQHSEE